MELPDVARVVVVGGYGAFGVRAVERLARYGDIEIVVAGRSAEKARAAAVQFERMGLCRISSAALDAARPDIESLKALGASVVINASGPFQAQDYSLARAAIATGMHYVDLADARAFVTGISSLDAAAREAGVLVTSGASSVPALAAAIIDDRIGDFRRLDVIEHAITLANGYDPGVATTASILGGLGQPMQVLDNGKWTTVYGWLGLRRIAVPGLGHRFMANCDVPDLDIFPRRYAGVRTVRFRAGLDVGIFQLGLWALAMAVRARMVRHPERLAGSLMWVKRRLRFLGGENGGMIVRLEGESRSGGKLERTISLIARKNQGPHVPVVAAVVVARKLLRGGISARGAMSCVGLMTTAEFEAEVADLDIEIKVWDQCPVV
jgi:hypothetical protein